MVTVAVRVPVPNGAKLIWKVVVPFVAATGETGCAVMLKSAAFTPLKTTLGVPVRFSAVAPVFAMVKECATAPVLAVALPKSVSSDALGVSSALAIVVLLPFTFMIGPLPGPVLEHLPAWPAA